MPTQYEAKRLSGTDLGKTITGKQLRYVTDLDGNNLVELTGKPS